MFSNKILVNKVLYKCIIVFLILIFINEKKESVMEPVLITESNILGIE